MVIYGLMAENEKKRGPIQQMGRGEKKAESVNFMTTVLLVNKGKGKKIPQILLTYLCMYFSLFTMRYMDANQLFCRFLLFLTTFTFGKIAFRIYT